MTRLALHWQILIAILVAALAGWLSGEEGAILGLRLLDVYEFLGTLFINALKMLIVPLIMSSIITGVSSLGGSGDLGRLGGKIIVYYVASSVLAVLMGLLFVNITKPGIVDGEPARDLLALDASTARVADQVGGADAGAIVDIFVRMIPTNIVQAASQGEMLGLIFFSILFGLFMLGIESRLRDSLQRFWEAVFQVMMRMTHWVMLFAPIGVFGLVAATVAKTGFEAAGPLVLFALTVLAALLVHVLVTLPILLAAFGRVARPYRMHRAMAPALLTAFSTASSSATLPVTMDCVEKNAGVSNRVSSFVLPLGATVNMDGTALYECVAAMFIAQAYGLELSFGVQFVIVVTAMVTSIGVAGIPSASLVAIAIILSAVGLPLEALGVLFVFDRVLDMCRTAVNVFGDSVGTVIVARTEGEDGVLADPAPAAGKA